MDPKKTQAVREWSSPSSVKEVQRFLGFSNFDRKFIRNFSAVVAPLTNLTRKSAGPFCWTQEAERAFAELKKRFTSAPILTLPDPTLPFIVEVDTSDVAVSAVLSQHSANGKIHPCAFFSCRLSDTERNYDVGDRELLVIKMALEEWCHWLEGPQHPFVVWTGLDRPQKFGRPQIWRLNPRQARWALFSIVLILFCLIALAPRIRNLMPCLDCFRRQRCQVLLNQSFQALRSLLLCPGELTRWFGKHC